MTNKAAEYRQLARDARKRAEWLSMRDGRAQLMEMAQRLETLADAEDERARRDEERRRFWQLLPRA
ncbi:MAG: hypothetical protein K2X71_12465 [Methylobacterium sp.]|uniref:hypothetical protein n=1 Tax=Methylobacterium sp. TaxID=409 RepID=UPI0025846D74|nr:hypothetical protein [Methylobacterium sp.]MBY0296834.1 hypothetical protein [Methylobacterium sp.]